MSIELYGKYKELGIIQLPKSVTDKRQYELDYIQELEQRIEELEKLVNMGNRFRTFYESLSLRCLTFHREMTLIDCNNMIKKGKCKNCKIRKQLILKKIGSYD